MIWFPELVSLLLFDCFCLYKPALLVLQPPRVSSAHCKQISLALLIAARLFGKEKKKKRKEKSENKSLVWGKKGEKTPQK